MRFNLINKVIAFASIISFNAFAQGQSIKEEITIRADCRILIEKYNSLLNTISNLPLGEFKTEFVDMINNSVSSDSTFEYSLFLNDEVKIIDDFSENAKVSRIPLTVTEYFTKFFYLKKRSKSLKRNEGKFNISVLSISRLGQSSCKIDSPKENNEFALNVLFKLSGPVTIKDDPYRVASIIFVKNKNGREVGKICNIDFVTEKDRLNIIEG